MAQWNDCILSIRAGRYQEFYTNDISPIMSNDITKYHDIVLFQINLLFFM